MELLNLFEGQRVVLRAFEADDAPALHALLNHPALAGRRYLPNGFPDEAPLSLKQVQDVIGRLGSGERSLNVAIVSRSDGTLLVMAARLALGNTHPDGACRHRPAVLAAGLRDGERAPARAVRLRYPAGPRGSGRVRKLEPACTRLRPAARFYREWRDPAHRAARRPAV